MKARPSSWLLLGSLIACDGEKSKQAAPAPASASAEEHTPNAKAPTPVAAPPADTAKTEPTSPSRPEARLRLLQMQEQVNDYIDDQIARGEGRPSVVCPNDGRSKGSVGPTPPLSVRCAQAPTGQCEPGGSGPGGYPASTWTDDSVWKVMGFTMDGPHWLHYEYRWSSDPICQFTVRAFADLDDDGIYSTFARSGGGDASGPFPPARGMYVDQEFE